MLLQLGNTRPVEHYGPEGSGGSSEVDLGAPAVTDIHIPNGYTLPDFDTIKVADVMRHLIQNPDKTNLPDCEGLLAVVHQSGLWGFHSRSVPSWVGCEDKGLESFLAEWWGIPAGVPADVEDTHHTRSGPPGVVPAAGFEFNNLIMQSGRDMNARAIGGGLTPITGAATASGTTSLTTSLSFTSGQYNGCRVFASLAAGGLVWGQITGTSAGPNSILTVDQWTAVPTTTGGAYTGASGTTPSATGLYVIADGNAPAWFIGLGNTNTSPVNTDTSMSGEIVTTGGGLIRKIAVWAHTAGVNSYTLTPVYTANGTDTLPVTVYRIGVFDTLLSTNTTSTMFFETLLSASATLSAIGDQLTITETVTLS